MVWSTFLSKEHEAGGWGVGKKHHSTFDTNPYNQNHIQPAQSYLQTPSETLGTLADNAYH